MELINWYLQELNSVEKEFNQNVKDWDCILKKDPDDTNDILSTDLH